MTHVEGPCMFWGQVFEPNKQQELSSITDSLSMVCPSSPVVSGQPDIGSKVMGDKVFSMRFYTDVSSNYISKYSLLRHCFDFLSLTR